MYCLISSQQLQDFFEFVLLGHGIQFGGYFQQFSRIAKGKADINLISFKIGWRHKVDLRRNLQSRLEFLIALFVLSQPGESKPPETLKGPVEALWERQALVSLDGDSPALSPDPIQILGLEESPPLP